MTRDDLVEVAARAIAAAYPHNDDPRWYRAEARAALDAVGPMIREHEREYAKRQLRDELRAKINELPGGQAVRRQWVLDLLDGSDDGG